jgi:hypothetical protein
VTEHEEDVAAEIRALRAEIRALHESVSSNMSMRHDWLRYGWLKRVVNGLETDPHVQYKVHLYGVVYWLVNFIAVALLFFLTPSLWQKLGVFIILEYSIYANFATDYGAMSAAMAAYSDDPLPEIPLEND